MSDDDNMKKIDACIEKMDALSSKPADHARMTEKPATPGERTLNPYPIMGMWPTTPSVKNSGVREGSMGFEGPQP